MLKEQETYLGRQVFTDSDGASYCVLRLVKWAHQNCQVQEIPISEITDPDDYADEKWNSPDFIERALASEDYPIILIETQGVLQVVDGLHRTWKAFHDWRETILAYVIPAEEMPISALFIADDNEDA